MDASQTVVRFEKSGNFLINQLRFLVPPGFTDFYR